MKCPTYVKNCIELIETSGHVAYAVGGAVRDSLLGAEPSDWDVTTSARPEEILRIFASFRTVPTGIKHGTVTVLLENEEKGKKEPIEITTFRVDGEYRDSRHPESVEFSNDLRDDLSRRDFTVNAMAFSEKEGLVDAFGGRRDLENRIIRAVGDPQKRFTEDALRILRAFRFSAQLEFEIEENTLRAASVCSHLLKNIARERVGAEFKKLVASKGVSYSLQKMIENGIWQSLFDIPCPCPEYVLKIAQLPNGNFATRLAALLVDYEEDEKETFLASLRLSNDEKRQVLRLCRVKNFEIPEKTAKFSVSARHFLHLYNNIYDEAKDMLKFFCQNGQIEAFFEILDCEKNRNNPLSLSDLAVKGSDILPFCVGNHAKVGKILNELLNMVVENPALNEKDKLIEIVKKELL